MYHIFYVKGKFYFTVYNIVEKKKDELREMGRK